MRSNLWTAATHKAIGRIFVRGKGHSCQFSVYETVDFRSLLFKPRSLSYKFYCGGPPFYEADVTRIWSTASKRHEMLVQRQLLQPCPYSKRLTMASSGDLN